MMDMKNWYTEIKMFPDDQRRTKEDSTPKRLCSGITRKKKSCKNRTKISE